MCLGRFVFLLLIVNQMVFSSDTEIGAGDFSGVLDKGLVSTTKLTDAIRLILEE